MKLLTYFLFKVKIFQRDHKNLTKSSIYIDNYKVNIQFTVRIFFVAILCVQHNNHTFVTGREKLALWDKIYETLMHPAEKMEANPIPS